MIRSRGVPSIVRSAGALLFFSLLAVGLAAQVPPPSDLAVETADALPSTIKPLPSSFHGITLGMSLDALKKALAADSLFNFRGDRDVSLLPASEQVLIETTGLSFVRRAYFQLREGKLFIMAFDLNAEKVDHYSVFTSFVADYGEPTTLDPKESVWLSDTVRVSVERPLTVKYIDRVTFDQLARDSLVKESREFTMRKEFLDEF